MKLLLKDCPNVELTATSNSKSAITDLYIKGCDSADKFGLLKAIMALDTKQLKYIALELGEVTGGTMNDIDTLYSLVHKTIGVNDFGRVLYNGVTKKFSHSIEQFPELTGSLSIAKGTHAKDAEIAEIEEKLGLVITILAYFIEFEDAEVESILKAHGVGTSEGITAEQLAAVTDIQSWFSGNTDITSFTELSQTGVTTFVEREWFRENQAFRGCTNLVSIDLSNIVSIPIRTFMNCSKLQNVISVNKVTKFSDNCFDGCSELVINQLNGSIITEIGNWAFNNCSKINIEEISLPNLTRIGIRAFYGVTKIKRITNLGHITSTERQSDGQATFQGITNLEFIEFPSGFTTLAEDTCDGNTKLSEVVLPQSLKVLDGFNGCTSLVFDDLNFPNLESIGIKAFGFGESKVKKITNLGHITALNNRSDLNGPFSYQNLLTSVVLPSTVTWIGGRAFDGCTSLTSVDFSNANCELHYETFRNCSALVEVKNFNNIYKIGNGIFNGCTSLVFDDLNFPNLESIQPRCFHDCKIRKISNLGSITTIPSDGGAYSPFCSYNNSQDLLTEVTLPSTLQSIGRRGFANCVNLTTITLYCETPPTLDVQVFDNCNSLEHIYVPASSVADYQQASGWLSYASIISAIPE